MEGLGFHIIFFWFKSPADDSTLNALPVQRVVVSFVQTGSDPHIFSDHMDRRRGEGRQAGSQLTRSLVNNSSSYQPLSASVAVVVSQ